MHRIPLLTVFYIIDIMYFIIIMTLRGFIMAEILLKLKKLSKADITAIAFIGTAFIYLVIFAFTDGTLSDEAFYISIPMRLMNGDGLFTDEWHLSQLSAVLLYLPVRLFTAITGGTEGIILYMRLLFCLLQLGTGILLFRTFRKYGIAASIISASFISFFMIGINTLSYNTLGLASLFTLICLIYRTSDKPSYIKMFLSGSLIAAFILCQPFGIIFYLAYFIAVCVFFAKSKNKTSEDKAATPFPLTISSFLVTVAGILPVLVFFLYLLFKNSDIETIFRCIPGIMTDVEHMQVTEELGIKTFSLVTFIYDMTMCAGAVPLIGLVVCMVLSLLLKKKNKDIAYIVTIAAFAVITLVFWIRITFFRDKTETDDIYFFFFPLALPGIIFYVLQEKKNKPVFILLWCTGITYALLMTISSNMRLHASVNGYIVAAAGTLLLAKDILDELKPSEKESKLKKITCTLLACTLFGFSIFNFGAVIAGSMTARFTFNSSKMNAGIYKGITLPTDQALIYTRIRKDAAEIKEIISPDDKIFVLDNIAGAYLEGEFNMGAFSGWFISDQLTYPEIRDRFRSYYEIFPENIPDYIYVPSYRYNNVSGINHTPPKKHAEYAYTLFEGTSQELHDGILIKVTGLKDEQN